MGKFHLRVKKLEDRLQAARKFNPVFIWSYDSLDTKNRLVEMLNQDCYPVIMLPPVGPPIAYDINEVIKDVESVTGKTLNRDI